MSLPGQISPFFQRRSKNLAFAATIWVATIPTTPKVAIAQTEPNAGPTPKPALAAPAIVDGNATIGAKAGQSEIVIRTTDRLAGAIDSLIWDGKEFVDSFDHGRQLQSALSLDAGATDEFWAERFNPTEAGSRRDHTGDTSTSRLIRLKATANGLETQVQMAFWLPPGEMSFGRLGLNKTELSNHRFSKKIEIGWKHLPHAIRYEATFHIADNEPHRFAQFEALTGYMPEHFSQFFTWSPETNQLQSLDDGPGEQALPVVFTTTDQKHAMAIFCPEGVASQPTDSGNITGPTYGRFRFENERVVKWNCVFRLRNPLGIVPGDYRFAMFVVVGTLEQVQQTLVELAKIK
jgi:hypothetical protein